MSWLLPSLVVSAFCSMLVFLVASIGAGRHVNASWRIRAMGFWGHRAGWFDHDETGRPWIVLQWLAAAGFAGSLIGLIYLMLPFRAT